MNARDDRSAAANSKPGGLTRRGLVRGAAPSLAGPLGLFNSSLDGNSRRAIDFHEGE